MSYTTPYIEATSGTPLITWKRGATTMGTFTTFLQATHPFRSHTFQPGDVLEVAPAVYQYHTNGSQDWVNFGPQGGFYSGVLDGLTIVGVQGANCELPVLVWSQPLSALNDNAPGGGLVQFIRAQNCTFKNIIVKNTNAYGAYLGFGIAYVGNSFGGILLEGCEFRGAYRNGINGLKGATASNVGTLTARNCKFSENGGFGQDPTQPGTASAAHAIYVDDGLGANSSTFHLILEGNHFQKSHIGHLVKSRAQRLTCNGNYFHGSTVWVPSNIISRSAESSLLDLPNGGVNDIYNNIFVKNVSQQGDQPGMGQANDVAMITYCGEAALGFNTPTGTTFPGTTTLRGNTFVAFSKYSKSPNAYTHKWLQTPWDGTTGWGAPNSGHPGWTTNPMDIGDNVFVGFSLNASDFDPVWAPAALYRAPTDLDLGMTGHGQMNMPGIDSGQPFTLKAAVASASTLHVGKKTYNHRQLAAIRAAAVKGYAL